MRRISLQPLQRRLPSHEYCKPSDRRYRSGRRIQICQQSALASNLGPRSGHVHDPLPRIKYILADLNRSTSRVHLPLTTVSAKTEFGRVVSRMLGAAMATEPTGPNTRSYLTPAGLRKIEPYWYPYTTMAKGRWLGREMLEVVSTEFRDRSIDYYVSPISTSVQSTPNNNTHIPVQRYALESGVTTINGEIAKPDTIIRNGDRIEFRVFTSPQHFTRLNLSPRNVVHRHEPPVAARPVKIIHHDTEREFIVIDKPGSIVSRPLAV